MEVLRHAFFPVEPRSALRSTQTQTWLTKISEDQALKLEQQYQTSYDKKGQIYWWKKGKNNKIKTLKSPPNYVRTKKYLDRYFNYKTELREHADKIGFIMPQDAFFIWFFMPMPVSWTKKKKALMGFKMHKNRLDTDNLTKGILDAIAPRKSNFMSNRGIPDDRVISSYANAKIYLPDEYKDKVGILIVEYQESDFLTGFFNDAINILEINKIALRGYFK